MATFYRPTSTTQYVEGSTTYSKSDLDNTMDLFTKELLAYFYKENLFSKLVRRREVPQGNLSAVFEVSGKAQAPRLFKPGDTLSHKGVYHTRKNVQLDGLIVAEAWEFKYDKWLSYWDVRQEHAQALAQQMAQAIDKNIFASILKAAAADTNLVGEALNKPTLAMASVTKVSEIDTETEVKEFFSLVRKARTALKKMHVPDSEIYLAISPDMYEKLFLYLDLINKDFKGDGSIADGTLGRIFGINIVETSAFYEASNGDLGELGDTESATIGDDWSADGGLNHTITVADGGILGLVFTKNAAAFAVGQDIGVESEYLSTEKATYISADMIVGFDSLRPECALAITGAGASITSA